MSSVSSTPSLTSVSSTDLFPTPTQSSNPDGEGRRGTNVYYLVFLGVLIVLLLLAGCLAFRAFRIRRRYRTATQLAIARGGPLPEDIRNEYWGLGGLSGWTTEGSDRFGVPIIEDGLHGGNRRKDKWQKIPKMWEGSVEEKEDMRLADWDPLELAQPVMVHSLRPDEEESTPDVALKQQPGSPLRPAARHSFSPIQLMRRRRAVSPEQTSLAPATPTMVREQDRELREGEAIRVGILIKMPTAEEIPVQQTRADAGSWKEEEATGWESGMEIGVWEGSFGGTAEEDTIDARRSS